MDVRPIESFLRELGLESAAAQEAGRRLLEEAGFTRAERLNMARAKEPEAAKAVRRALAFHCGAPSCEAATAARKDGRLAVQVRSAACEVCQGSANRQALDAMVHALRIAGLSRLLVVGGTPALFTELRVLSPEGVRWRFIDGTRRVDSKTADQDLKWADVVVVWGSTPLPHKVSRLYTSSRRAITAPRRGIAALAQTVQEHADRRQGPRDADHAPWAAC